MRDPAWNYGSQIDPVDLDITGEEIKKSGIYPSGKEPWLPDSYEIYRAHIISFTTGNRVSLSYEDIIYSREGLKEQLEYIKNCDDPEICTEGNVGFEVSDTDIKRLLEENSADMINELFGETFGLVMEPPIEEADHEYPGEKICFLPEPIE